MQKDLVARVFILDVPYRIDKLYEYSIPTDLCDKIRTGVFATVNFGKGKRQSLCLVYEILGESDYDRSKLKPITKLETEITPLTHEQIKLCLFISEQTFCTFGTALKAVVPSADFKRTNIKYTVTYTLTQSGFEALSDGSLDKSPAKFVLLERIADEPNIDRNALLEESKSNSQKLKSLLRLGYIKESKTESYRAPFEDYAGEKPTNVLTEAQNRAFCELKSLYESKEPRAALLHGVTGSGKTRVIKAMCDEVLASGRQVIILVPEIALTPQAISLFASFYRGSVAVLHSSLSAGERYDAFRRMREGKVNICIGTRSAVFAPFENIGMIVIDEEQEHTYKSDSDPKYHTVDIARFRCAYHNSLMLLASATPSLASYYKAKAGKYTLVKLTERYNNAPLPDAKICDMRGEISKGDTRAVGKELYFEIKKALDGGKQAIVFVNRRGYNNYLTCTKCGATMMCPHCSVSLTNHTVNGRNELRCHYCGYRAYSPSVCPECKSEHLRYVGFGTQHVEQELSELFPDAVIVRMDADTTKTKFSYEKILSSFKNHSADILIGTQMVTKGHDFPDVTLCGVLLADMTLYVDDYRANERTFSLLTQVIGRAGRGDFPGKAVIQTYNPDHPVLTLAAEQNYEAFYENEIALRRALTFPPVCDIFLITLSGKNEPSLLEASNGFRALLLREIKQNDGVELIVFGPFEAPIYKLSETFRMRFVCKGKSNTKTRALFRTVMEYFAKEKFTDTVGISIDVNPSSL